MPRNISSQELFQIGSTAMGAYGPSRVQMGVVSPCSACANQLAYSDGDLPACPRRNWAAVAGVLDANGGDPPAAILTRTGSLDDSSGQLVNPVHSQQDGAVLVWVATLDDNQGMTDHTGAELTPDILDPGFDTEYIVCRSLPFVPDAGQAAYNQAGVFKEMNRLLVHTIPNFQLMLDGSPVQVSGFVRKVDFSSTFSFLTPASNTLAVGC